MNANPGTRRFIVMPKADILEEGVATEILFGLLPNGDEDGDLAEMMLRWRIVASRPVMRLEVFDENLAALAAMPDVVAWLGYLPVGERASPSVAMVTKGLTDLGFEDATRPPEPRSGSPLFMVNERTGGGPESAHPVHLDRMAWGALEWCRRADRPDGTVLTVRNIRLDADEALLPETPIASFEFTPDGIIHRDGRGRIITTDAGTAKTTPLRRMKK